MSCREVRYRTGGVSTRMVRAEIQYGTASIYWYFMTSTGRTRVVYRDYGSYSTSRTAVRQYGTRRGVHFGCISDLDDFIGRLRSASVF